MGSSLNLKFDEDIRDRITNLYSIFDTNRNISKWVDKLDITNAIEIDSIMTEFIKSVNVFDEQKAKWELLDVQITSIVNALNTSSPGSGSSVDSQRNSLFDQLDVVIQQFYDSLESFITTMEETYTSFLGNSYELATDKIEKVNQLFGNAKKLNLFIEAKTAGNSLGTETDTIINAIPENRDLKETIKNYAGADINNAISNMVTVSNPANVTQIINSFKTSSQTIINNLQSIRDTYS